MRFLLKIILWGTHISIGLWALIIMCFHIKNQTLPSEGERAMKVFIGNIILAVYALLVAYIY
ncbi:Uncharacterized protein dnl_55280 [Desulfonema limicola]|uniref:Uncharacterized protein n=1 Tax=Desulfonema limicola TaxID=45656 RepID=A0A975BCG4_9BACT|nr:hypothetical protein [Desulfonema limicola]QTA83134.1 Uncharacterized protein dnl_55280 [Desulfonema limicola]